MMDQLAASLFSAQDFRIRAALERGPYGGDGYGDQRFNPQHPRLSRTEPLRNAAVLVRAA